MSFVSIFCVMGFVHGLQNNLVCSKIKITMTAN